MPDHIYSVSEITSEIREVLETTYTSIWVEGEISNHRLPGSGHHYFTLKDSTAQLSCVLFRGAARNVSAPLEDGQQVQILGNLSVYEARGQYQLIAQMVQPKGFGELQAKFEALKRKLEAEGLFDPARKRPIPTFPKRIGIVTSPTGAAIQDILNVLRRRAPWIQVVIQPVRVQGEGAEKEIADGVRAFFENKQTPEVDLVLVTRGGGSIEDLWCFNEEVVARAIADCPIPVMTGVGHEIDFTIADFVADRREPTPSAAAENSVPDGPVLLRQLQSKRESLESLTDSFFRNSRNRLGSLFREMEAREPTRKLQNWIQSVDYLGEKIHSLPVSKVSFCRTELALMAGALSAIQPWRVVSDARVDVRRLEHQLTANLELREREIRSRAKSLRDLLDSLSPHAVLRRGFSYTTKENGETVRAVEDVAEGDLVFTHLADGKIASKVEPGTGGK